MVWKSNAFYSNYKSNKHPYPRTRVHKVKQRNIYKKKQRYITKRGETYTIITQEPTVVAPVPFLQQYLNTPIHSAFFFLNQAGQFFSNKIGMKEGLTFLFFVFIFIFRGSGLLAFAHLKP